MRYIKLFEDYYHYPGTFSEERIRNHVNLIKNYYKGIEDKDELKTKIITDFNRNFPGNNQEILNKVTSEIINEAIAMSRADFLSIAKQKWDDLYKYTQVIDKDFNMNKPVRILCKKHGPFNVTPLEHIKGKGCPDCTGSKGFEKTINQQGYIPDTTPEPSQHDMTGISPNNKNKERENQPHHVNQHKTARKLTHHKTGGGRGIR